MNQELMSGCKESYKYTIIESTYFNIYYFVMKSGDSTDFHKHVGHSTTILLSGSVFEEIKQPRKKTISKQRFLEIFGHHSRIEKDDRHRITGICPVSRLLNIQWGFKND